jgi:hypothetical protein
VPDEAKGAMPSWRGGPAKKAIMAFVAAACGQDGSEPVPPEEREGPAWFATVMTEHHAGDDHNVKKLAGGVLAADARVSVEDFETRADTFLRGTKHPTLGRGYLECAYAPMVELLALVAANGFANYIVSGGGRDFMRPITQEVYGIPRERVIGSATALAYTSDERGGTITLRLLVLHDDAEREFGYSAGAEQALEQARPAGWTTVSVRDDWATVF